MQIDRRIFLLAAALTVATQAQTVVERRPYIRASGEGVVAVKPDQVRVNAGVITTGATAEDASNQNAAIIGKVISDIRTTIGTFAEIRTVSISVNPFYRTPVPNTGVPQIAGYNASNYIEITLSDQSLAGKVIDTATKAGANNIGSIRFTIKDPSPAQQQALRLAMQQARLRADAIATGMGARAGRVIAALESSVSSPSLLTREAATLVLSGSTPVEAGTLEIRATVVIETEILN